MSAVAIGLAAAQGAALALLLGRLARGRRRPPAVRPRDGLRGAGSVSVVVPARNEAHRIGPCLEGLVRQGAPVGEILVVDGGSTDGTRELVRAFARRDARIRLLDEPPRPAGAVGRPWAIAAGCERARGDWIMIVDADARAREGMVGGALGAARDLSLGAVSFAPRIVARGAGARWLQPSLLTTLVYRFGPPSESMRAERALANGQCMLLRRSALVRAGGYRVAAESYCDDVRVVRHLAASGVRVGFLDGRHLLDVEMYPTAADTWRGWPRSLNLRDATTAAWRALDSALLVLAQALPIPLLAASLVVDLPRELLAVNLGLLGTRLAILVATAPSFAPRGFAYWLSPLADLATVLRVVETTVARPREWRGAPRAIPRAASA